MANLRLEVEIPPPAGKFKNLIKNPNGDGGGWGWSTPTGGSIDGGAYPITPGWLRYSYSNSGHFTTESMPVAPGRFVTARWKMSAAAGITIAAQVDYEDAAGALLSSTAPSTAFASAPTTDRVIGPFTVPAGAAAARLRLIPAGAINGNVIEIKDVGFVDRPTNAATTWATDVVDGPTWLNVLSPATELSWDRTALDLGNLTATIRDATIDPTTSATIRPGRACRVQILNSATGAWDTAFPGELTDFEVTYDPQVLARYPGNPKHAIIELSAVDATRRLANARRPTGVHNLYDLRVLLEDAGVPWSINGNTGHTNAAPVVVSYNENASVLDQIAVTRDSRLALAWLDRRGVVNVFDAANVKPWTNTDFETDVAGWGGNGTRARVTTPVASGTGSMRITTTVAGLMSANTTTIRVIPGHVYSVSIKTRAATTARSARVSIDWRTKTGGTAGTTTGALTANTTTGWTTHTVSGTPPTDAVYAFVTVTVQSTIVGEQHYVDELRGFNADVPLDQSVWTDIAIGSQSGACINEVNVKFLRYDYQAPTVAGATNTGTTEEIPYGPYRNEASIAEYGTRSKTFTIQGLSEAVDAPAFAAAVLAANSTPRVAASSVRRPIKTTADLTTTGALADLMQTAAVSFAAKGYAEQLRITSIKHTIRADPKYKARWIVDYAFADTTSVPSPRVTPSPATISTALAFVDTPWIYVGTAGAPPFLNGWSNYGTGFTPARFCRRAGITYVQGLIQGGTSATVAFTLPIGFRTVGGTLIFPADSAYGPVARTDVDFAGNVAPSKYVAATASAYHSLAGIQYPAEA